MIEDACEELAFMSRDSIEIERYQYLGGMRSFGETFKSRLASWIDQIEAKTPYDQIDGSGLDALKVQRVIEAAIESWQTHRIIDL
jgi:predicted dehydrogenase